MSNHERVPTMGHSLSWLRNIGVDCSAVLDVGILNGTPALEKVFADKHHVLFEPIAEYLDNIRNKYRQLDYELHNVALSSVDGDAYIIGRSIDRDGKVTYSHISDVPVENDPEVVSCYRIRKVRLDTFLAGRELRGPYLLKVDVDGHELEILKGATEALKETAIVVVEAPLGAVPTPPIFARMQHLLSQGFRLFDIVDLAYYRGVLSQVDLVFVNNHICESIDALRPWQTTNFDRSKWYPLTSKIFNDA